MCVFFENYYQIHILQGIYFLKIVKNRLYVKKNGTHKNEFHLN